MEKGLPFGFGILIIVYALITRWWWVLVIGLVLFIWVLFILVLMAFSTNDKNPHKDKEPTINDTEAPIKEENRTPGEND